MINCFLIDDDTDDQEIFLMALDRIDPSIQCRLAENGLDAWHKLSEDDTPLPDIIFVDLNMPVMSGKDFLKKVKQSHLKDIPVVVYSTSDEALFKSEMAALGATGYIVKTITFHDLVSMLKAELNEILGCHY